MWLPESSDVQAIHFLLAEIFQKENDPISPAGIRSAELLSSACARPHIGIASNYKYKTLEEKLAALFHSLTKNHPFHNGNKRTAVAAMLTALQRNDRRLENAVSDDDLYEFVVAVTSDSFPEENHTLSTDQVVLEISNWIKRNSVTLKEEVPEMRTRDFILKCEHAGASVRKADGATLVSTKDGSVKIRLATKKMAGPVIRQYLKQLGLNEARGGFTFREFEEGPTDERAQIYRYIKTLRRLAKT